MNNIKKIIKDMIVKLNVVNILSIPLYIFRIFPIKNNRILFENFTGKGYADSPKSIAEKLIDSNDNYELYWVIKDNKLKNEFPPKINTIKLYSLKYFYILATAKVWVSNSRFDQYVVKRKKQFYIQTWHGGLGMKKIEYDAEDKLSEYYKKVMKKDNKNMNLMISNSKFCTELYRRAFRFKGDILEVGTPRNDVLINNKDELSKKARKKINIDKDTKILLYAPTFRLDYSKNPYDINFKELQKVLEIKTKEKWIILVKLHPRVNNSEELLGKYKSYINDVTSYSDIQELICACDMLITDYSSTEMEAMIADKPVVIYANDVKEYTDERGFSLGFDEIPFKITENNDELLNYIEKVNFDEIKKEYSIFMKKVGLKENGKATNAVCDIIREKIKQ